MRRQIKLGEKNGSETVTIGSLETTRAASEFSNEIFRTRENRIEQCTIFLCTHTRFSKIFRGSCASSYLVFGASISSKKKRNSFSISEGRGFDSHGGQKIFSLPRVVPCFPLLGLTPSGLFMGLSSTLIYTSDLILCSTICVPSSTRHSIQSDRPLSCCNQENPVTPNNKFELKEICLVRSSTFGTVLHRCRI